MIDGRSYYEILEVDQKASSDEIRKSFRTLSKRYHPDVSKLENAAELFDEVQRSYEVLYDDALRKEYDLRLLSEAGPNYSFEDVWSVFDVKKPRVPGENVILRIKVSIEDLATGKNVKVTHSRNINCECVGVTCVDCNGTGSVIGEVKTMIGNFDTSKICVSCNGIGHTTEHTSNCNGAKENIKVEKDIDLMNKEYDVEYVFPGEGDEGSGKAINGSLIVILEHKPVYNGYELDRGNDVRKTIPLKLPEFINPEGTNVEMPNGQVVTVEPKLNNIHIHQGMSFGPEGGKGNVSIQFTLDLSELNEEKSRKLIEFWREEIEN